MGMAVASSSSEENKVSSKNGNYKAKRSKCPGIRVVGNRVYDSQNGKTCHQCRQKTMVLSVSCKNLKVKKPCPIYFCYKCLLNRYGEKAEEVEMLDDWKCPRCRGICNCSFCMKKRGHKPTGQLVQKARIAGYSSVSEMLNVKVRDNFGNELVVDNMDISLKDLVALNKGHEVFSLRIWGKEKSDEIKSKKLKWEALKEICRDVGAHPKKTSPKKPKISEEVSITNGKDIGVLSMKENSKTHVAEDFPLSPIKSEEMKEEKDGEALKNAGVSYAMKNGNAMSCKVGKGTMNLENKEFEVDIPLPQGASLMTVADIDLPPEDVELALQFLEFCASFGKSMQLLFHK
ncbi:hypothetical protein SO802_002380 [Lithocarpus litseifolius]|uniref:Zinc-finger domain-containing protein n=1 Tax=Lithocarpus litseifolius TaxID=425828 RepID=A0AAW2DY04_9ROSI